MQRKYEKTTSAKGPSKRRARTRLSIRSSRLGATCWLVPRTNATSAMELSEVVPFFPVAPPLCSWKMLPDSKSKRYPICVDVYEASRVFFIRSAITCWEKPWPRNLVMTLWYTSAGIVESKAEASNEKNRLWCANIKKMAHPFETWRKWAMFKSRVVSKKTGFSVHGFPSWILI